MVERGFHQPLSSQCRQHLDIIESSYGHRKFHNGRSLQTERLRSVLRRAGVGGAALDNCRLVTFGG